MIRDIIRVIGQRHDKNEVDKGWIFSSQPETITNVQEKNHHLRSL